MSDPLDRLRAVDPTPTPVSTPHDPHVRATLEDILMTDTTEAPTTPAPTPTPLAWYRNPRILAVAAALLFLVGVVGATTLGGNGDGDFVDAALPLDEDPGDDAAPGDLFPGDEPDVGAPPADSGSEVTSCVEMYSPETLTNREYAFDGTITAVDGNLMTFDVNEWFTADEGPTVTLDHQGLAGGLLTPDIAIEPGTRVLVAGDGGFVWSCGFIQLWFEENSAEWRAATAG